MYSDSVVLVYFDEKRTKRKAKKKKRSILNTR